jgi:hypothetical protein
MFMDVIEKIKSFEFLKEDWDSYGAQPIGKVAIQNAINTVIWLKSIGATNIAVGPTADDSVNICYERENYKHSIECFSDTGISMLNGNPSYVLDKEFIIVEI